MKHRTIAPRVTVASILAWCVVVTLGLACGADRSRGDQADARDTADHEEAAHDEHGEHGGEHAEHEEGHVTLSHEAREAAGIEIDVAAARTVAHTLELPGEIVPNADRLAHIVPRFPGIAREVRKGLGDRVARDEVLAIVESNESLAPYEVRSLIAGTVIEKHITLGEFVRDDADVYVVADLSTVWANITVYARDLQRVTKGLRVEVRAVGNGPRASGAVDYVAPALGETMRAATARVTLPNPDLGWRPGMFVTATIATEETHVPVAVRRSALQRLEGADVVFIEEEDAFEARPVVVGLTDPEWAELRSGLDAGTPYVAKGAFILKSELLKSEAGHDH